jgi:hypothetical protein
MTKAVRLSVQSVDYFRSRMQPALGDPTVLLRYHEGNGEFFSVGKADGPLGEV